MNAIVSKPLLGDKFMPEMHLKQHRFTESAGDPVTKKKERIKKKLKKQEVQDICIKTNYIKLVFNMIWLTDSFTRTASVKY